MSPILLLADLITQREKHPDWKRLVGEAALKASRGNKNAKAFLSLLGLKVRGRASRPQRERGRKP
jgi:hypothetical protein